jgi:hypothetical protein
VAIVSFPEHPSFHSFFPAAANVSIFYGTHKKHLLQTQQYIKTTMNALSVECSSNQRISAAREQKTKKKSSVTDALETNENRMIQMDDSCCSSTESTKSRKSKSLKKRRKKSKNKSKKKRKKSQRKVSFGTIQVLEFNYTIGHHSVTCKGPPLGLSSILVRSRNIDLDIYEKERQANYEADEEDMFLSPDIRTRILREVGFSVDAIERADIESQLSRIQRKESVLNMQWDEWNAKKERVRQRVRRWANPKGFYEKGTLFWRRCAGKTRDQ